MMTGKCYFNALHSKPEMVTTLLMQSDSFTTKQVLLNITFRNYAVSKLQLPLARINAIHSESAASSANPKDAKKHNRVQASCSYHVDCQHLAASLSL